MDMCLQSQQLTFIIASIKLLSKFFSLDETELDFGIPTLIYQTKKKRLEFVFYLGFLI